MCKILAVIIVLQSNFCHNGCPSKTEMRYYIPQCRSTANRHPQTLGEYYKPRNLSDSQWNGITYILHQQKSSGHSARQASDVFWDAQGIILLDFLETWATVNSERYIKTLIKLMPRIACTESKKNKTFLQHNDARRRASRKITECVIKFSWTVLPHPHIDLT